MTIRDAQRAELLRLAEEQRLTVKDVIATARDEASPLHGYFTWDPDEALQKNLETEARELIRSFKITVTVKSYTFKAPEFIRDLENDQGYVRTVTVKDDVLRARDAVSAEIERVIAALTRARAVSAVLGMQDRLASLIDDVDAFQADVSERWSTNSLAS